MCGRFACSEIPKALGELFGLPVPEDLPARRNIAPSMNICALLRDEETKSLAFGWLQWGLVPFWAKEKSIGNRLFNARCETAHEKPSFRAALRHRRCLIPADGFYEWGLMPTTESEHAQQTPLPFAGGNQENGIVPRKRSASRKQPYYITLTEHTPMVFAGLWEVWHGPGEELLLSCTILTTDANEAINPIHERMPVILPPQTWELWMNPAVQSHRELAHLWTPYPHEYMNVEKALPDRPSL